MPKKKTRVLLGKKIDVGRPITLVDRPSTYRFSNPSNGRALSGHDDASALADSGRQMIRDTRSAEQESREGACHLFNTSGTAGLEIGRLARQLGTISEIRAGT